MPNLFDLPPELLDIIVKNIPTAALFDLITGKVKPDQIIDASVEINENASKGSLKNFYKMLRLELFARRGPQASRYQSSILGSWLHHWPNEKKLSFIKNPADKKEWLKLLNAALQDPKSTFEHKLRCCLLINKLFPNSQDITPQIIQSIMTMVANKSPIATELKAFGPQFSQAQIQLIFTSVSAQLNDANESVRLEAARALRAISPHLSNTQNDAAFTALLTKLNANDSNSQYVAAVALAVIAPHVSKTQSDALIATLIARLNDTDSGIRYTAASALAGIAPHVSQAQCDALMTTLIAKLYGAYLYISEVETDLAAIAPYASTRQCDTAISALLNKLNDTNWDVRINAATALGAIAPHLSQTKCDAAFIVLPIKLNNDATNIRYVAVTALGAIAPRASKIQCDAMSTALFARLNDVNWEIREAARTALCAMAPHLSKTQCDSIFIFLLAQLNDADSFLSNAATATAIGAIAPHLSKTQCDAAITALLTQLNDWMAGQAAATTLGAIAPYVSKTQCDAAIIALLTQLNDASYSTRQAAAAALANMAPTVTDTELKRFLEMPGDPNFEKMSLQLIVQTRLHINHPEWNPQRDLGVYFSRINHGILTERKFNLEARTWNEPRTWRLWSEVGDKRQTVDDCMTEIPNRNIIQENPFMPVIVRPIIKW